MTSSSRAEAHGGPYAKLFAEVVRKPALPETIFAAVARHAGVEM